MTQRSIQFLNYMGDVTIVWDEDDDQKMIDLIQGYMDKGVTFFKLENRALPFLPKKRVKVKSIDEIKDDRVISLKDEKAMQLVADGVISVVQSSKDNPVATKRLKTAKEVASSTSSMAIRPLVGG